MSIDCESIFKRLSTLPNLWKANVSVDWAVETMFPSGAVNLISAASGTGKSFLAYALAGSVAQGKPFLGLSVKQMPVLYIDKENPQVVIQDRLVNKLAIPELPPTKLSVWEGSNISDPPFGPEDKRAIQFAEETKGLMIWDSLVAFHPGSENDSTETRKYMHGFRVLANYGATVVILHHTGKGSTSREYRGSSDIPAVVDTAFTVTGKKRNKKLHRLEMKNFKCRVAAGVDFTMEFTEGRGFHLVGENIVEPVDDKLCKLEALLTPEGINGSTFKKNAKQLGESRRTAEQFLKTWDYKQESGKNNETLYFSKPNK